MKSVINLLKVLSDEKRLRMLMLLTKKEMCVCQLMGVIGASQPLVSRNLSILMNAGLLSERREGKLRFYRIREDLEEDKRLLIEALKKVLQKDKIYLEDLETLKECTEFQKMTGRCDMETFKEFMKRRKKKK
jgi:ArsR family transcriptional regulator